MSEKNDRYYKISLLISYIIFGTIGIVVRYIPLSSGVIAAVRGVVGALFILLFKLLFKKPFDREGIRKNALWLLLSGGVIGFNWIFLFEAYKYTSIATATLCYYMAPVFVSIAAPFLLKERFSREKGICVAVAFLGMIFASGVFSDGDTGFLGIVFGLSAAVLYAAAIICNKKMSKIEATDRAWLQLLTAGIIVIPYVLFTEDISLISPDVTGVVLLLTAALLHTGVAYVLNLAAVGKTPAQTVAVLSYLDPIVAIIAAAVCFGEIPDIYGIIGTVLVLGAAFMGEVSRK